ncbi:MAG TPA: cytochrome c3 family protein, partial [Gammaproteobacteria bacterium]|nr:cytochrome c3 family protein [Gammaproteobacteria bacterium]
AAAQVFNIERLVMPGPVIEAHASVEESCSSCHVSDASDDQDLLCGSCHHDVLGDRQSGIGFHGLHPDAVADECGSCHQVHEGRDAQAIEFSAASFNHFFTDLPLVGGHIDVECAECHAPGAAYRQASQQCGACHDSNDVHMGALGADCAGCHSAEGWHFVQFDHSMTMFPLRAAHAETACVDCHRNQSFVGTPLRCASCHRDDDVHDGGNGAQCADCHSDTSWAATNFEHWMIAGFALEGSHRTLACQSCHTVDLAAALPRTCVGCHQSRDVHRGSFGDDCAECHSPVQWAATGFDHSSATGFNLSGAHAQAQCGDCHSSDTGAQPAADCISCHAPDPHRGQLSSECADCHGDTAWQTDVRFDHGLAAFPLIGAHATEDCGACHATVAFHDAEEDCAGCHAEDDYHAGTLGEVCATCHSPVGWQAWMFDHGSVSQFPLSGAHATLGCASCHQQDLASMLAVGTTCASCHRNDDPHDGRFGADCGSCHTTEAF